MAYNTNAESGTLYPRTLYALYIGPNNNGIGHLIFGLSIEQLLTTMEYKSVPVPGNLFKSINERNTFTNKIQFDSFNSDIFIGQDDHFYDNENDGQT